MEAHVAPEPARTGIGGFRSAVLIAMRVVLALFVVGVVVQVFLAGLSVFGDAEVLSTHAQVGWSVHTISIVLIALALLGPRSAIAIAGTVGLFVLNTVQILLSGAGTTAVAALHPTLALAVLAVAVWLLTAIRPSRP